MNDPADFFPAGRGTTWVYTILIGKTDPISHSDLRWPISADKSMGYSTRGFLPALVTDKSAHEGKHFLLEISVKGTAKQLGQFPRPKGVELTVKKDELGVYSGAQQVFWGFSGSRWGAAQAQADRFMAEQVVTYPRDGGDAPSAALDDGSSIRLLFFADQPDTAVGPNNSPENLVYIGVETQLPKYEGTPCLHFRRIVKAEQDESPLNRFEREQGYLNQPFIEDMWFAKGRGLVRLEQNLNGVVSMIWQLTSFLAGQREP